MATLAVSLYGSKSVPFNAVPVIRLESDKITVPVIFEAELNLDDVTSVPVILKTRQLAA